MGAEAAASAASSVVSTFANTRDPGAVLLTSIAFFCLLPLIWHLTSKLAGADSDRSAKSLNRLVALVGGLCGWVLAVLFTPYSDPEAKQFIAISTVVSVFLSGYVISKLDRFLERALFGPDSNVQDSWARAGLFTATLLLACVTVFTARLYAASNQNTSGATGITLGTASSAPKSNAAEPSVSAPKARAVEPSASPAKSAASAASR